MNWKRVSIVLFFMLVLITVFIVLVKPAFLQIALFNAKIPSGTIIVWMGFIGYAFLFYVLRSKKATKILSWLLFVNLMLAVFWGAISAMLAGNWAFNFSDTPLRALVFKIYIICILVIPILVWIVYFLIKFLSHLYKRFV